MSKPRRRKLSRWWPRELSRFGGTICLTVSFRARMMMSKSLDLLRTTKREWVTFLITIVIPRAIEGHRRRSAWMAADQLLLVLISCKCNKKTMRISMTMIIKRVEKRQWWTLVATIVSRLRSVQKERPMAPTSIRRPISRWRHFRWYQPHKVA